MEFKTIKGYSYVVTANTASSVTDSHGLNLQVAAGAQQGFVATGSAVSYSGDCTIVQVRGNFNLPSTGGGGGGQITIDPTPTQGSENAVSSGGVYTALRAPHAPTPEPLGTTTTLKHGHVYTLAVAADTDLSALGVELYATAELWIDYTAGSVDVSGWDWQEDAPDNWEAGKRYCIVLRNDGDTIATVNYVKDTPAQP